MFVCTFQVPDNGHVFILFGPHIGISDSGELGKCLRLGQTTESGACGAVLAAYNSCKCGQVKQQEVDMSDMQQSWLKQKILSCLEEIESSSDKMQTLIHKAYHAVEEHLLDIINHDYGSGKLILLGGIQVLVPMQALPSKLFFSMPSISSILPCVTRHRSTCQHRMRITFNP